MAAAATQAGAAPIAISSAAAAAAAPSVSSSGLLQMTDTERLLLHAAAAQLDLLCLIAKAVGAYHGGAARNLQEKIEAVLNSQTADEVDRLK